MTCEPPQSNNGDGDDLEGVEERPCGEGQIFRNTEPLLAIGMPQELFSWQKHLPRLFSPILFVMFFFYSWVPRRRIDRPTLPHWSKLVQQPLRPPSRVVHLPPSPSVEVGRGVIDMPCRVTPNTE